MTGTSGVTSDHVTGSMLPVTWSDVTPEVPVTWFLAAILFCRLRVSLRHTKIYVSRGVNRAAPVYLYKPHVEHAGINTFLWPRPVTRHLLSGYTILLKQTTRVAYSRTRYSLLDDSQTT